MIQSRPKILCSIKFLKPTISLMALIFTLTINSISQDTIFFNTGFIPGKVVEITTDHVKYRKLGQELGPLRSIDKREVTYIKYSWGEIELYNISSESTSIEFWTIDKIITSNTKPNLKIVELSRRGWGTEIKLDSLILISPDSSVLYPVSFLELAINDPITKPLDEKITTESVQDSPEETLPPIEISNNEENKSSNLAIGWGYGSNYGGFGGRLGFVTNRGDRAVINGYFAFGFSDGGISLGGGSSYSRDYSKKFAGAIGVSIFVNKRFFFDLSVNHFGFYQYSDDVMASLNSEFKYSPLYGYNLSLGHKLKLNSNLGLLTTLGYYDIPNNTGVLPDGAIVREQNFPGFSGLSYNVGMIYSIN